MVCVCGVCVGRWVWKGGGVMVGGEVTLKKKWDKRTRGGGGSHEGAVEQLRSSGEGWRRIEE